ncbi:MAG: RdgB/HAM1 family non-canonical purine NTP pyrophosphatase [Kiritimatiellia bacterium]|jgi:XTP/dITP diphosphohydrolase
MNFPLIVVATRNPHKLAELRKLLGVPVEKLRAATDFPGAPDVEEDGATFEANALIKARGVCAFTSAWALADDSGLEVDALGGAPGVHSARYAGHHGDDEANNRLLLDKLADVPASRRTARFACAIALVSPDGREFTATGVCPGQILFEPRGSNGFGYDPLFLPDGHDKTFAELASDVKCAFSHRAAAAAAMRKTIQSLFGVLQTNAATPQPQEPCHEC